MGKPVRFVMTSEDVLHDFFVPDMRVKRDIVPGRYTEIWFTPDGARRASVTCAEYCGKGHSDMNGEVIVDTPADFEKWMETGGDEWMKLYAGGVGPDAVRSKRAARLAIRSTAPRARARPGKGSGARMVKMNDGNSVLVDEAYVRESMMQPQAKIVAGFEPIMPTFQGLLREQEIRGSDRVYQVVEVKRRVSHGTHTYTVRRSAS